MKKNKKHCVDCGGAPVNHCITYVSILLGKFIEPWTNWMGKLIPESSFDCLGPAITKTLAFLKLGKITYEPKDDDSGRTRVLWEEAIKRGIKMYEFRLFGVGHDVFVSNYKGDKRFFDVLPRPKIYNPKGLEWMDNKGKMKTHFEKDGIKVARGGVVHYIRNLGSRSRHTTTHLSNDHEFLIAFKKARQLSPWVMIEEELSGYVFRGTLIGGKLTAVLRREPAYVIGDGEHNIREIIDIENKNPRRDDKLFHKLHLDDEAMKELKHWGHTADTIPKKDEIITLGQKTSRAVGGGTTDMTDVVHPDNKEMLEKVAQVLDDPLIGVDFIMNDVAISWRDQPKCGVIECNSAPFIDLHHFPLVGQPRNVASALWDIIYPSSNHQ
jgi:D-alanine-D-alanine ligase-like ATP-grasp enzyme